MVKYVQERVFCAGSGLTGVQTLGQLSTLEELEPAESAPRNHVVLRFVRYHVEMDGTWRPTWRFNWAATAITRVSREI